MSKQKEGLDYFPLDTNIELDDKFALINAKYGITGYGVIVKMFTKIYGDKGYYYGWNENTQLLFSARIGVEVNKVIEIINDAVRWEIFDKKMFEKYQILTSKRIQETFLEAAKRRRRIEILKQFLLLNGDNVYIKGENVYIIDENAYILEQSKVKESKVKKSKVKESKVNNKDIHTPHKKKYADFVSLTEEEYQKLISQYGEDNTKAFINKLNVFKGANGKKYKSDYLAILNWVVEAVLNKGGASENNSRSFKRFGNERLDDSVKSGFYANIPE
jgi:hypothetical protein